MATDVRSRSVVNERPGSTSAGPQCLGSATSPMASSGTSQVNGLATEAPGCPLTGEEQDGYGRQVISHVGREGQARHLWHRDIAHHELYSVESSASPSAARCASATRKPASARTRAVTRHATSRHPPPARPARGASESRSPSGTLSCQGLARSYGQFVSAARPLLAGAGIRGVLFNNDCR
jgi:hypothetical protein